VAAMEFIGSTPEELIGVEDLILFGSAASAHVRNTQKGAININDREMNSILSNNTIMKTSQVGDFPLEFSDKTGRKTIRALLSNATISPGGVNIFAPGKLLQKGWTSGASSAGTWITSPDKTTTLMFDVLLKIADGGVVHCARIKPLEQEAAAATTTTVQRLDSRLSQGGETATTNTAEQLESKNAPGPLSERCAIGRLRQ
jgi:hypothetical protein